MTKKVLIILISLVLIIVHISCSDDDNPAGPNEGSAPKQPTLKEIEIPEGLANKQDPYAQMAVGFMHMANGFKAFSSFFTPPSNNFLAKLNDDGTFNWNVGGLAITMEYFEEQNVGWRVILNGTDGEFFYADWIYLEGEQALGGESGQITCFKKVTTEVDALWEWTLTNDGVYTMTMIFNDEFDKVEIIDNGDLSGFVYHYEFHEGVYKLIEKIQHNTDMSGEYWVYDILGNLLTHGFWD